jgi:hypothetical protein
MKLGLEIGEVLQLFQKAILDKIITGTILKEGDNDEVDHYCVERTALQCSCVCCSTVPL